MAVSDSSLRLGDARGLTLIEITVSIAIIGILIAAVIFALDAATGATAKKATGQLASTIRGLYDEAALTGRTCRMVFILPEESRDPEKVNVASWHAECAEGAVTTSKDRDRELEDANDAAKDRGKDAARTAQYAREKRNFSLTDQPSLDELLSVEKNRVEQAVTYGQYKPPTQEPLVLPETVKISVWTRTQKKPVTSGVAYLYFHPQGYTERAHVYVSQGDNVWTIKVSPLTGKTEVVPERAEIPQ